MANAICAKNLNNYENAKIIFDDFLNNATCNVLGGGSSCMILTINTINNDYISPYKKYGACHNHGMNVKKLIAKICIIDDHEVSDEHDFNTIFGQKYSMQTVTTKEFNNEVVMQSLAHEKTAKYYEPICPSIVYASNDYDITKIKLTEKHDKILIEKLIEKLKNDELKCGIIIMSYLPDELYKIIDTTKQIEILQVCFILLKLAIKTNIWHGDPHYPNIILLNGQPVLIDYGRSCLINTTIKKEIETYAHNHEYTKILNLLYDYDFDYTEVIHDNPDSYSYVFDYPSNCINFDKIITAMFEEDEIRNKTILNHHKKTKNKNKIILDKTMLFDYSLFM
jgi:hypothetical protein